MSNVIYATEADAVAEVNYIIERWDAQRPPFSDANAKAWVTSDVVAQRMIKARALALIKESFADEQYVLAKQEVASNIYSTFVQMLNDFRERHRSVSPPSGHSQGRTIF